MKKYNFITKQFLIKEYAKNEKTIRQIAKRVSCSPGTIRDKLIKYSIPRRTRSETLRGNKNRYIDGRRLNKYYCIDCDKEISIYSGIYGNVRCKSCAQKITAKEKWEDKKFRTKTVKASMLGRQITPNKPEKLLNKMLQKLLPNEYKFVGDGKVILGGFCPDFINRNGQKKIIELYGDYWHTKKGAKQKDKRRIKVYKKYGYKTLIVWQHELKDLRTLKNKILIFNKKQ